MGGGCGVTETALFNPALLAIQDKSKIFANYYNRYSVGELATVSGGLYFNNEILPVGVDITSFGYDQYRESMFRISAGKQIAEKISLGIAIQYAILQSQLFEETTGRVSTDIGIVFKPVDNLLTALSITNFPSFHTGDENIDNKHIAPYSIQLGFNYSFINNMLITGSVEHAEDSKTLGVMGLEYMPFEDFSIRAGFNASPFCPSLGVGYKIANIQTDVGMVYHRILGVSMGIGISYSF
jgi:hypothetical protein